MQWVNIAAIAGVLIPIQTGFNMQLSRAVHSPLLSAIAVFAVGLVFLAAVAAVTRLPLPSMKAVAAAPVAPWFVGGILAAVYVILLIVLSPRLGAATTVAFVVVGQVACSMMIDQFGLVGFAERGATALRLMGLILMVAGVALVRLF